MIDSIKPYQIDEVFKKDSEVYYEIPKYQREYTWGYKEWDALYDDLLENNQGYFIGTIISVNSGDSIYPVLEIIDGQQRLTTISLFLAAIYSIFFEYKKMNLLDEEQSLEMLLLSKSLTCSKSKNGLRIIPQIQNFNFNDYSYTMRIADIVKCHVKQEAYVKKRKIFRCFDHIRTRIKNDIKKNENPIQELLSINQKVCGANLVKIEVSSHSNAYMLFESLNHRGTPLSAIDLMKNTIMANAEKNNLSTDDCFNKWQTLFGYLSEDYATQERFFRQYYNAFKRSLNIPFVKNEVNKKRTPLGNIATRSNLLSIYEKLIERDLSSFLNSILECGQIYYSFIKPNESNVKYAKSLLQLSRIEGSPSYVLLLYLIYKKVELSITDEQIDNIIKLLVVFFVRRNITDTPSTRDLTSIFMNIINEIEENNACQKEVSNIVYQKLSAVCAKNDKFELYLNGDIYEINKGWTRFILCALAEKSMTTETWTDLWEKKTSEKGNYTYIWTIEHIFPEGENIPQAWINMIANGDKNCAEEYRKKYVHTLGNLTITAYNSSLSNMPFEQKRDRQNRDKNKFIGYKNGLGINESIKEKEKWTIQDIIERTKSLVKEILEIYKYPSEI